MAVSDTLEAHFKQWCLTLDPSEFNEFARHHVCYSTDLLSKLRQWGLDEGRRPLKKMELLRLRTEMLNIHDARELAMQNYPTIRLGEVLTEAQITKAKEIIDEDGPHTRTLLIREVLDEMDPPDGVRRKHDDQTGQLTEYGPFLPAYLAYAIIYAVNKVGDA
jgi:hypothetical protein